MISLELLRKRIKNTENLLSIVKTMKALSASSIRKYQQSTKSILEYFQTIETSMQIILKFKSEKKRKKPFQKYTLGAIILGSDQGMCGKFNEQITSFFIKKTDELKDEIENKFILTLGEHVKNFLEDQNIEKCLSFPVSLEGMSNTLQEVLKTVDDWHLNKKIDHIFLFHNKPISETSYKPSFTKLLPIDLEWLENLSQKKWPSNNIPTFSMKWDDLFLNLIQQYFFIVLNQSFTESLLSENSSRLLAMRAAEKHIEEHIEKLNLDLHQRWQNYITEEILEIETGYESLKRKK